MTVHSRRAAGQPQSPGSRRKRAVRPAAAVAAAWLWAAVPCWSQEPVWPLPTGGSYQVGVRAETRLDRSRPFRLEVAAAADDHARPIRMLVWYPATAGEPSPSSTYADYLAADRGEPPGTPPTAAELQEIAARLGELGLSGGALDAAVKRLLSMPVAARFGGPEAAGRFPVVVIGPGGRTPPSLHLLLGEHLASHGYVAVAIPSLPRRHGERWPFDETGIDMHLRDLELALDHVLGSARVDRGRLALVAWSVGGVAQALMQMRNPDIGALVSLDGATGYAYGLELLRSSIHFAEEGVSAPYLHAHGLAPARFEVEKEFTVFESLSAGPSFLLTFPELSHPDFMSRGLLERWAAAPEASGSVVAAYTTLLRTTRRFLDAFVARDKESPETFEAWLGEPAQRRFFESRSRP